MTLAIEVAYATPQHQEIIKLTVANPQIKLIEVIQLSGILAKYPEIDINNLALGVYGKRIYDIDNYTLNNKDRIEIYRPLLKSPNQKRLERAKTQ